MRRQLTSGAATAALALAAVAAGTAPVAAAAEDGPVDAGITVPKVENLPADFMNGVDVSSILSLEESGVTFRGFDGQPADLFEVMAEGGVNYVRVRVWNDPYDAEGNGYGGGDVDAARATEIGQRATAAGMKVFVDFHYADFWAHPGQQPVPKAWVGMTAAEKADALYAYTAETLQGMVDAGVDVGMVQIGNETTNLQLTGESWPASAPLFDAGSRAVRDTLGEDVKIAVHFTNPERGTYMGYAAQLASYDTDPATEGVQPIDYDVFASSYYAYWHGTTENLTSQLRNVADTYGKDVIVAETSWAYTLEDGDGYPNNIRTAYDQYSSTVQGQALAVRDVIEAVANVGDAGLGVFYWEPAWLPVGPPEEAEANALLWEEFGSGWASSYAGEYSADAAANFGGSGWDNQAMFAHDGTPLESLRVWDYVRYGTVAPREVDEVSSPSLTVVDGDPIVLPATVAIRYTDGTSEDAPVAWSVDPAWIIGAGTYEVPGTAAGAVPVTATITVIDPAADATNYVINPGFEAGVAPWTGTANLSRTDDPYEGSRSAHFYLASGGTRTVIQEISGVPAGDYRLSVFAQGRAKVAGESTYITASAGIATVNEEFSLAGYLAWQNPVTDVLHVQDGETVTVSATMTVTSGGWGTLDSFALIADVPAVLADTSDLEAALVEARTVDPAGYTAVSFLAVTRAIARGDLILGASAPSQAAVDAAAQALVDAIAGLVEGDPAIPAPTVDPVALSVVAGDPIDLPSTVTVRAYDGSTSSADVAWDDVLDLIAGPGVYPVRGVTADGLTASATVTVSAAVLLRNGGFEQGVDDVSPWSIVASDWPSDGGFYWVTANTSLDGSYALNFYAQSQAYEFSATQALEGLPAGTYRFSGSVTGADEGAAGAVVALTATVGDAVMTQPFTLPGWGNRDDRSLEFTVAEGDAVTVGVTGSIGAGDWGYLDAFALEPLDGPVAGDATALDSALARAAQVERWRYTDASIDVLDLAVARAAVVLGADAPAQEAIDQAAAEVEEAFAALAPRPADVAALESALAQADAVVHPYFTRASLKELDAAVAAAAQLTGVTALEQERVDAAADAVAAALEGLVLKPQFVDHAPPGLAAKG